MLRVPRYIEVDEQKQLGGSTIVVAIGTLLVHRKHTKKDLYLVKQLSTAVNFTDYETIKKSKELMQEYSKLILASLQKKAESGEYIEEDKKGNIMKYYYNDWKWYDRKKGEVVNA